MKILHINSYYAFGGFYKNLYEKQVAIGLDIDVFVPTSDTFQDKGFDYGKYTLLSKNHGKYDRVIFHNKHRKIFKDISQKYALNDYSIVHAHSLFSNGYIAYRIKQKYQVPFIVAVRDTDANVFFKKMLHFRKLGIEILHNAEKIVFISEPYKRMVIEKYIPYRYKNEILAKSVVIPNGIDEFWLNNRIEGNRDVPNDIVRLIFVGALSRRKNLETTVEACKLLLARKKELTFKVIGEIANPKYEKLILVHPFIEYVPHMPKEDLIKHYRSADIFVMPSRTETFGLVYAEAMSQGLPVIYTRGQGFDGQFEEGEVGFSVQFDSAEEIANKIIEIIDNYKAISTNCVNEIDRYNWSFLAEKYLSVYSELQ